jgi:hypothetical protein
MSGQVLLGELVHVDPLSKVKEAPRLLVSIETKRLHVKKTTGFIQSLLFCPLHLVDRFPNALTFPTQPLP